MGFLVFKFVMITNTYENDTYLSWGFEDIFWHLLLHPQQELIGLIKNTKIPVICMCNDRNSQKIRSLANYCFDLRFQRPRVEQIKVSVVRHYWVIYFKEIWLFFSWRCKCITFLHADSICWSGNQYRGFPLYGWSWGFFRMNLLQ